MRLHANIIGFNWDKGNKDKNLTLHKVGWWECEEVFLITHFIFSQTLSIVKMKNDFLLLGFAIQIVC